ncbi:MAG: carbohydrate kinase family protein [Defluviitaleaceae bacterium]|nr:carbohydrate kinase family protein [Defluviitaleaceae bacterium]
MYDIVGVDWPCIDLNINVKTFPKPNGGEMIRRLSWQGGGKVSSGLTAAGRLGVRSAILGAVGDDIFGRFCRDDFERHNVDTAGLAARANCSTPFCTVISDQDTGGRSIIYKPGTSGGVDYNEVDKKFLRGVKYFFIAGINDDVKKMSLEAKSNGAEIVIDADGYSEHVMDFAEHIDVFVASEAVYAALGGNYLNTQSVCESVIKKGPSIVVFTMGEKGCAGLSAEGYFELPAYKVEAVDTVGAGDVYHGAFIAGLLDGRSVVETARFASACSAVKCCRIGGRAGVPNKKVLEDYMASGIIDFTEIDERCLFYERGLER